VKVQSLRDPPSCSTANTARHTFLTHTPPWMIGRGVPARDSGTSLREQGEPAPSKGLQQIGLKGSLRFWKPDNRQVRFLHLLPDPRVYSPDSRGIWVCRPTGGHSVCTRGMSVRVRPESTSTPRDSSRAWIVHPAGLDTVSKTVGASPPGVRVPRYPPGLEWTTAREAAPIGNRLARQRVWVGSKSLRQ
jgi:hypothetical protein